VCWVGLLCHTQVNVSVVTAVASHINISPWIRRARQRWRASSQSALRLYHPVCIAVLQPRIPGTGYHRTISRFSQLVAQLLS